ncbi:adenylate/guanylate cyclase domain-containing protein, partial [Singulisphaera rosea]
VVAACLRGASEGALILLWDILCPICRIPSQVIGTLQALREHGNCAACQHDFELDFANSVELIFRAHPEIRAAELGTFCIGGPAHSPHVVAQARIGPGERLALDLNLGEGSYRIRGPQLAFAFDFRVGAEAKVNRLDLSLTETPAEELPRSLKPAQQTIALENHGRREILVRIERLAPRDDAFTAARASSFALFRSLFPGEILSPGQLINLETVTLVVTELHQAGRLYGEKGDAEAFAILHEHFRILDDCVRSHRGALIKTIYEGMVAVFSESVDAVKAALDMVSAVAPIRKTAGLVFRLGVHRGPAMVVTLNDHLDYFGTTVNVASRLPACSPGGLVLSAAVASDPRVAELLRDLDLTVAVIPASVHGLPEGFVHPIVSANSDGRSRTSTSTVEASSP